MRKFESLQKDETEPNWLIPGKLAANLGHLRALKPQQRDNNRRDHLRPCSKFARFGAVDL